MSKNAGKSITLPPQKPDFSNTPIEIRYGCPEPEQHEGFYLVTLKVNGDGTFTALSDAKKL